MEPVTATATATVAPASRATVLGALVRGFGVDPVRAGAVVEVSELASRAVRTGGTGSGEA